MRNLAGDANRNEEIERELARAGINIVRGEKVHPDITIPISGELGSFKFQREWAYWVVTGLVPIAVARELYKDPVGVKNIRVVGHAGCPEPDRYAVWFMPDGRLVVPLEKEEVYKAYANKGSLVGGISDYVFSDDPESIGAEGAVTHYHIDTELGLRIFADTLKKHFLV